MDQQPAIIDGEDALRLFQAEAEYDDTKVQIQAINRILPVALALGPDRARLELVPYLNVYLDRIYVNDEIQMHLADQIANLLDLIGGEEHVDLLFELLIKLVSVDEGLVRCSATSAMITLIQKISKERFQDKFIPFLVSLKSDEWFTAKSSLLDLTPYIYNNLSDELREGMREYILKCCHEDESPLVRKTAARCLINFAECVEQEFVTTDVVTAFNKVSEDSQDTIRMLAVDISISICKRITQKEIADHILLVIDRFEGDESWRIRAHVANQILNLQKAIGPVLTRKTLVNILTNLAKDSECNVRKEVAANIVQFCKILQETNEGSSHLDPIVNTELLPLIIELAEDRNQEIEGSVTMHFRDLCKLLGPARSQDHLMPIVMNLIKISIDNIREEYMINLNTYIKEIGCDNIKEDIQEILSHLMENKSSNWRSKREALSTLYLIIQQTDSEYFKKEMLMIYKHLLRDTVYSVRKVAPILLPLILKKFGQKWFETNLLATCLKPAKHSKYLYRISCLSVIDELITPSLESHKWTSAFQSLETAVSNNSEKASSLLCRIIILTNNLESSLDQSWVSNLIELYEGEEYYNDQLQFYAENVVQDISSEMGNSIVNITEDDYNGDCYAVSLLILLVKHFIPCIQKLSHDKIENVRLRAARSLFYLQVFLQSILKSLSVEWVRNFYANYDEDNLKLEINEILEKGGFDDLDYSSDEEMDSRHGSLRRSSKNATIAEFERWSETVPVLEETEIETSMSYDPSDFPVANPRPDGSTINASKIIDEVIHRIEDSQKESVNGEDSVNV